MFRISSITGLILIRSHSSWVVKLRSRVDGKKKGPVPHTLRATDYSIQNKALSQLNSEDAAPGIVSLQSQLSANTMSTRHLWNTAWKNQKLFPHVEQGGTWKQLNWKDCHPQSNLRTCLGRTARRYTCNIQCKSTIGSTSLGQTGQPTA